MHLLVTQPYLPAYRVPLFDEIASILATSGDKLTVCIGRPTGAQERRGDSLSAPWSANYSTRAIAVGSRKIQFRKMPLSLDDVDVVVSELEGLNTFAWKVSMTGKPLVLWGHGKSYVNDANPIGDKLEWALGRRAAHIMTYSPGGREYLISRGGFRDGSVTVIGNSTDTATLRSSTARLMQAPGTSTPVKNRRHALYVGGLDPSKRIDFLLAAAREAKLLEPSFKLHVVGRGALESIVDQAAAECNYIERTPESRGDDLAQLAWANDAIWMPGRVGLVAVDALAMGLPVHTTAHKYHAPEVEFLEESELIVLPNSPSEFATASIQEMAARDGFAKNLRADIPTIETVARNFVQVVYETYGGASQ
jgi:glycosyltransferase involved in cell wall biosynthesis